MILWGYDRGCPGGVLFGCWEVRDDGTRPQLEHLRIRDVSSYFAVLCLQCIINQSLVQLQTHQTTSWRYNQVLAALDSVGNFRINRPRFPWVWPVPISHHPTPEMDMTYLHSAKSWGFWGTSILSSSISPSMVSCVVVPGWLGTSGTHFQPCREWWFSRCARWLIQLSTRRRWKCEPKSWRCVFFVFFSQFCFGWWV